MKTTVSEQDEAALRRMKKNVEDAFAGLSAAETQRGKALTRMVRDEAGLAARFAKLDPDDEAEVAAIAAERGKVAVLRHWVENAPGIRAAISRLSSTILSAAPLMKASAQTRSVEEFPVSMQHWRPELDRLYLQPVLSDQVDNLRRVAQTVLGEMTTLLHARRAAPLTREEREEGSLKSGPTVVRRLTHDEQRTGFAHA